MKCPKCGSEVQESKFCSECGAPLIDEAVAQEKAQAGSKKKPCILCVYPYWRFSYCY